ncbi:MAG: Fpg/Nei family DNA glycosylase, partial [Candidatus Eisenbacteria bacterium]|nr:Fpg/Nei family DNA glycosylase [Candidatus Eisenbacteria bacterium]
TQRKLGEIGITRDIPAFLARNQIGPDALDPDFDAERWRAALRGRRGGIKAALMNQEMVAGIGNVYADEILLRAGIHPQAKVAKLGKRSQEAIHRAMRTILEAAISARVRPGEFPSYFILPHREEGAACPRCGRTLETIQVSGRTTYYCPRDQRRRT